VMMETSVLPILVLLKEEKLCATTTLLYVILLICAAHTSALLILELALETISLVTLEISALLVLALLTTVLHLVHTPLFNVLKIFATHSYALPLLVLVKLPCSKISL